jgi:hypothetical protein
MQRLHRQAIYDRRTLKEDYGSHSVDWGSFYARSQGVRDGVLVEAEELASILILERRHK